MTNLTKKAKIALGSAGGGLLALAVALGIWQPWAQPPAEDPGDDLNQNIQQQMKPPQDKEEKLTLTVGNKEIPCTLFEGDGWTIYLPEEWAVDPSYDRKFLLQENGDTLASVEIIQGTQSLYSSSYISISSQQLSENEEWRMRSFYSGDVGETWEVLCQAPVDAWDEHQRLMTAMVRTMTVGDEMIFSGLSPIASEPEWQVTEDGTILWMDKDGYIVNDPVDQYICTQMMAWPNEEKANFTGQYRLEDLTWASSYTCLTGKEYVDIFRTRVWYEVLPGRESEVTVSDEHYLEDGWLTDGFYTVAIYHDGSAVGRTQILRNSDSAPGQAQYISDLLYDDADSARDLTGDELKACTDWFNDTPNNGLLRFAYPAKECVGDYLHELFYDLGQTEATFNKEEIAVLEKAGIPMELDVTKLTKKAVAEYLQEKLGFGQDVDAFLEDVSSTPGVWMEELGAWYHSRGDTMMNTYTFDRGEFYPSDGGYVKLYYTAPYLSTANDNMEINVPMVVTLKPGIGPVEDWIVVRNVKAK